MFEFRWDRCPICFSHFNVNAYINFSFLDTSSQLTINILKVMCISLFVVIFWLSIAQTYCYSIHWLTSEQNEVLLNWMRIWPQRSSQDCSMTYGRLVNYTGQRVLPDTYWPNSISIFFNYTTRINVKYTRTIWIYVNYAKLLCSSDPGNPGTVWFLCIQRV